MKQELPPIFCKAAFYAGKLCFTLSGSKSCFIKVMKRKMGNGRKVFGRSSEGLRKVFGIVGRSSEGFRKVVERETGHAERSNKASAQGNSLQLN
jgi:hypothetical protein